MTSQFDPAVAVIIPAYFSDGTIVACLRALREQTYGSFTTFVVDSTPDDRVASLVGTFDEVQLIRSPRRLLPHAARNLGVAQARQPLLAFTDPDISPAPDWLEHLVRAHSEFGGAVVGSMLASNTDWSGEGIHLAKFDIWLPGGVSRPMDLALTGNLLMSRELLESLEGFNGRELLGDMLLSWGLTDRDVPITFVPDAVVYHDHRSSFRGFLKERFERGQDFARLRAGCRTWGRGRRLTQLIVTLLPLRLINLMWRCGSNARRAQMRSAFILAVPWVFAGHSAWLAGEAWYYVRSLWHKLGAPDA